ncbi:MAG: substrate-binding domain-containing protein [Enterocloster bolteae]
MRACWKNIPDGGDIFLIQGPLTDNNVSLIREGIDETLAGSNLNVVYEANCPGWIAENAYTYTKEGLKLDRNVKGIICGNDDLASQAFRPCPKNGWPERCA